jgi:hypothetical protein
MRNASWGRRPTISESARGGSFFRWLLAACIMLDGLLKRYKPVTSIIISSLLFGFVHLNPWQFVTGFVFGSFLGWVYFRSGSIAACILIHMSANFSGYLCRLFGVFDSRDQNGGIFANYGRGAVDLFDPPQRERHGKQILKLRVDNTEKEVAKQLGLTITTV